MSARQQPWRDGHELFAAYRDGIGFVYCIQNEATGACKVGWARNPFQRIQALRTGNDGQMHFVGWFPGSRKTEHSLHRHLTDRRIRGEWFEDVGGDLIEWFRDTEVAGWQAWRRARLAHAEPVEASTC